ncbi:YbaN family protein [Fusobacterium massiliense]|uniref:YbaN family protein n=1 Tax=Fusobacterium massiliense TaxID=1852365 RepID=UPI0028E2FE20|nr:YbaN family protein [Fusobacterium massiliense]
MKNIKKKIYLVLGFISVALGSVGIFLPVLPTVPFLLLAIFCFRKSSEKYKQWILKNKYFGESLSNYYEGKGLTKFVKIKAILFLTCGIAFSIYKLESLHLRIFLAVVWLAVSLHIIMLKNK